MKAMLSLEHKTLIGKRYSRGMDGSKDVNKLYLERFAQEDEAEE